MQTLASLDSQSADRIACDFGEQRHSTDRQLNDDRFKGRVGVNGGDHPWQ